MNTSSNTTSFFKHFFFELLVAFIICFLIFFIYRITFLLHFASDLYQGLDFKDKLLFWDRSVRFDLKYTAFSFLPVFILGLTLAYTKITRKIYSILSSFLIPIGIILTLSFSIIDFYYYQTYERVIDTFIFSVFKEDPIALAKTIYKDYPLIPVIIILIVFIYSIIKIHPFLVSFLEKKLPFFKTKIYLSIFVILSPILYFIALRGGYISTFPIRKEYTQISPYAPINSAVSNGLSDFYEAQKYYRKQIIIPKTSKEDIIQTIKSLGFTDPDLDIYTPIRKHLSKRSQISQPKPDIVLSIMESLSTHMLSMLPNTDLYGELKKHIEDKDDFYFKNFISEGNGTQDSLTRIMFSVPDLNLSTSSHSRSKYITSFVDLFHNLGYKVIFIISSTGAWRDIQNFLLSQNIDEVYDLNSLIKKYPQATQGSWGVDDEYLFKFSYDLLKQKHDRPLFILTMSITNHPPHRVPDPWEPKSIAIDDNVRKRFLCDTDPSVMFATLRYANDQFGRFISSVKEDKDLKDNTIIAFTGDHNVRAIGYKSYPDDILISFATPFYLHLPLKYKNTNLHYVPNRYASHKDILSTIIPRISDEDFYSFGCDLLSKKTCPFSWAYNDLLGTPSTGEFICNLDPTFNFNSVKIKEGLYLDSSITNIDNGKCDEFKRWVQYQKQLYYYQAQQKN